MFVTKKHKGVIIRVINPEAIPALEERLRKMTVEMIMAERAKENMTKTIYE